VGVATGFPLFIGENINVTIRATAPNSTFVTLFWGSITYPSSVMLPLSGYESVDDVRTLDASFQEPTTTFSLNVTQGANVVHVQAFVSSAFGRGDIRKVNLTIVGPNQRPVVLGPDGQTNAEMDQFPPVEAPPYPYFYRWVYPLNSSEGVYRILIDVIDIQNQTAFSFRGPASLTLARPNIFLTASLNIAPYAGVAGVGFAGALIYWRRRKARSYLVPFDHFSSLTGGEINGGTVVTIQGNTGSGKTMLSQHLMFEDLKKGRPCVFVATGDFPSNIRESMKTLGQDVSGYEQNGLLTFVDCYSSEAGQESREKFSVPSLGDLTTLGIKITSSLPPGSFKGGSLYFDSLTPLASKAKPESIVSFVQSVGARVKGMSGKAFFTVGSSIDGSVQRQMEELSDCLIQMEAFEERGLRKSRLRVAKYRSRKFQQGWVIYTVEDGKGIIFYSKRPKT
jgi:KaiC/GvpD/RAD55 family RecA-like ATPase